MPATDWKQLQDEYDRLNADPDCRQFKPLLETAIPYLEYKEGAEAVQTLLTMVKQLRDGTMKTASLRQQAAGIVNETVKGPVLQGEILNVVFNAVERAKPEMKLPDPGIEIDIVLLVMTNQEASELTAGTAFDGQPDILKQNFDGLVRHLQQNGNGNWAQHYGAAPGQWRPRGGKRDIAGYIGEALEALNKMNERLKEFAKPVTPVFRDIRALDRLTLSQLRERCIVVVDAISIRHPALLRAYQRSMLEGFPNTSVVTITPDGNAYQVMKSMVYSMQMSFEDSEFNQRLQDPLGDLACLHCSETEMAQWLLARVRKIWASAAGRAGIRAHMKA